MTLETFRQELDVLTGGYVMPESAPAPTAKPARQASADTETPADQGEDAQPTAEPTPAPVKDLTGDLPAMDDRFLMLASAAEPLSGSYAPKGLVSVTSRHNDNKGNNENGGVYMASSQNMQLVDEVLDALTGMFNAAEKDGVTLYLRQAYRSYEDEQARYERMAARGNVEDKPGESDWQTGLAVSVVPKSLRTKTLTAESYLKTKEGQWVAAHCAEHGFIVRYPEGGEGSTGREYEPWHLRYVGVEAAEYITENGLCLEEFLALLG